MKICHDENLQHEQLLVNNNEVRSKKSWLLWVIADIINNFNCCTGIRHAYGVKKKLKKMAKSSCNCLCTFHVL